MAQSEIRLNQTCQLPGRVIVGTVSVCSRVQMNADVSQGAWYTDWYDKYDDQGAEGN
jgi:hypothetical protein